MATQPEFQDYYSTLGVPRTATQAEIKKAFRGLARTLHPNVSEEPDAEARFREVVEAYEGLSKTETRELYARYGHAGLSTGGFTPTSFDLGSLSDLFSAFFGDDLFGVTGRTRRRRGADVIAQVEIDLAEAASGTKREVPFPVSVPCATCDGSGAEPGTEASWSEPSPRIVSLPIWPKIRSLPAPPARTSLPYVPGAAVVPPS